MKNLILNSSLHLFQTSKFIVYFCCRIAYTLHINDWNEYIALCRMKLYTHVLFLLNFFSFSFYLSLHFGTSKTRLFTLMLCLVPAQHKIKPIFIKCVNKVCFCYITEFCVSYNKRFQCATLLSMATFKANAIFQCQSL